MDPITRREIQREFKSLQQELKKTMRMDVPNVVQNQRASVIQSLTEAFGYVRRENVIMTFLTVSAIFNIFGRSYVTLLPVFAKDVLQLGASGFGFISAGPGLGTIIGSFTLASLGRVEAKPARMRILGKFLGSKDREALEESWEYAAKMPAKPYAVESAVQAVLDHLSETQPRFAQYRPSEFIDSRLLAELDKSGYIDRLYSQTR